jgi:hypothetical protein
MIISMILWSGNIVAFGICFGVFMGTRRAGMLLPLFTNVFMTFLAVLEIYYFVASISWLGLIAFVGILHTLLGLSDNSYWINKSSSIWLIVTKCVVMAMNIIFLIAMPVAYQEIKIRNPGISIGLYVWKLIKKSMRKEDDSLLANNDNDSKSNVFKTLDPDVQKEVYQILSTKFPGNPDHDEECFKNEAKVQESAVVFRWVGKELDRGEHLFHNLTFSL